MSIRRVVPVVVLSLFGPLLAAAPAAAQPDNESFANAVEIGALPFEDEGNTSGAGTEDGEPAPTCAPVGATVWYRLIPTGTAHVELSTFGSKFDTVLAVYSGSELSELSEVACNDDDTSVGSMQSRLSFTAESGQTYHIQVGGYEGDSGALRFAADGVAGILNDRFEDAIPITELPFTHSTSTVGATLEEGEPQPTCVWSVGSTVWYRLSTDEEQAVSVDTHGSNFDTALAVYTGTELSDLEQVACNLDDGNTLQSRVMFRTEPGLTYYVQAGGYFGDAGTLQLTADTFTPPANDRFEDAEEIASIPFGHQMSTEGATTQAGEPTFTPCGPVTSTVWFRHTATALEPLAASTLGSDFDTVITVYRGESLEDLEFVACNDFLGTDWQSVVGFTSTPGETYYIQVGGWGSTPSSWSSGDLHFRLSRGAMASAGPVRAGALVDDEEQQAAAEAGALLAWVGAEAKRDQDGGQARACAFAFIIGTCTTIPIP